MPLTEWITSLDFTVLYWMQDVLRNDILDSLCAFISWAFQFGIPWFILGAVLFCFKKTRAAGVMLVVAVALTFFFGELAIKNAINRERPCTIDTSVILAIARPDSYSFPSGHTASAFAAAGVLMFTHKKLGIPFILFAVFMGFSRMYLFVHFLTDVIAGVIFGILMAWVTILIFRECKYDQKLNSLDFKIRRN